MKSKRFLIKMQYLGFRYHGVQKQVEHLSIHEKIEKTLKLSIQEDFKIRFASRTDALVSAEEAYFLLMFNDHLSVDQIKRAMAKLPSDLRILDVLGVADDFTIISNVVEKEYRYYFSHNEVPHGFAAPFMTTLQEELNIELMMEGAKLFTGEHWFENYCYKPKINTIFKRSISQSEIIENTTFTASFFPKKSFVFIIRSKGFMRGQVRLIMGTLFRLGKNEITLSEISHSLKGADPKFVKWMVPSSGLILHQTKLLD